MDYKIETQHKPESIRDRFKKLQNEEEEKNSNLQKKRDTNEKLHKPQINVFL